MFSKHNFQWVRIINLFHKYLNLRYSTKNISLARFAAAVISFDSTKSKLTASPMDEEIYPECKSYYTNTYFYSKIKKKSLTVSIFWSDQAFALLGTDNYETFAVYASCTPFSAG